MKIRNKFLLSIATVAVICATTLSLTSCSGISKDILNNLVSRGDGTKFGSASWLDADQASVQNVIQRALTDPTASKAFKKNAVNQILYNWYKNYATGSNTISEFKKN
jgi:hypothetical protein